LSPQAAVSAPATIAAYAADCVHFVAWRQREGRTAVPAEINTAASCIAAHSAEHGADRRRLRRLRSITEAIVTTTPVGADDADDRRLRRVRTRRKSGTNLCWPGRGGRRGAASDPAKRREIAERVISGRKTGAEMARLYNISPATALRIVAAHRTPTPPDPI
jgi:hypothetical protein